MNVYAARQRLSTGKWDYTLKNSAGAAALGYCSGFRTWTAADLPFFGSDFAEKEAARLNEKYAPFKDKFHADGHDTAEEAENCYREYLLDHHLKFSEKPDEEAQHHCAVCGDWTQHAGFISSEASHQFWHLCPRHQTREAAEGLFKGVVRAWSSA